MRRTPHHRTPRRVRWTPLERGLITLSLLLILGSAGFEAYQWVSPPVAPAAPRKDEATATATAEAPTPSAEAASATVEPEPAVPGETPTTEPPTAEPTLELTLEPPTVTSEPATVTPVIDFGVTPLPTFTPLPTLVIGGTPLVLEQTASGRSAKVGSQFSYFLAVRTASADARTIEIRDSIDSQLEVVEASSTSGTCGTSNLVVCVVQATSDTPAEVIINVRVRDSASPGLVLVSQALARDDQRETAASERVTVTVDGATSQVISELPPATALPTATATARPTEKLRPAPAGNENPTAPSPTSIAADTPPVAPTSATPEAVAAADVPAVEAVQVSTAEATVAPAVAAPQGQQATPALPPTLAPVEGGSGAGPVNPSTTSPVLPNTSASLPIFGFGIGLMGIALTLHGTRRVRRADARFSSESAKLGELGPLVLDAADFQEAAVEEIERMRQQSEEMREMLRSGKAVKR